MLRTTLAAAVLALAPSAHAAEPPGPGLECGFQTVEHPLAGERWVGEVDGGPVVIGARTGRLSCSLQVDDDAHAAPDAARETSLTTTGVVHLAHEPFEFVLPEGSFWALCTEVAIDGEGTWYWDAVWERWSADPETARCVVPVRWRLRSDENATRSRFPSRACGSRDRVA